MAEAVYDLIHQLEHDLPYDAFLRQLTKKINSNDYQIYVATENEKVIAFGELLFMQFIYEDCPRARLTSFCIHESCRNKKVGSRFLDFLEQRCQEKNCVSMELTSNARRRDAHRFYEQNGFIEYSKMYIKRFE